MDKLGQTLLKGGAVILPTETVYGIFARALDEKAVDGVYQLKKRPRDKAMNLNVSSLDDMLAFSKDQPPFLHQLVKAFLPGPLTIILKANDRVPHWVNSGMATVGFRMPDHQVTLTYIKDFGPLIGPSANVSGHESGKAYDNIIEAFKGQVEGIKDDQAIRGIDSTILDISGPKAKIIRQGLIGQKELQEKVPELIFEDCK